MDKCPLNHIIEMIMLKPIKIKYIKKYERYLQSFYNITFFLPASFADFVSLILLIANGNNLKCKKNNS